MTTTNQNNQDKTSTRVVLVVEFDEEIETNEGTADEACQELLDQPGKDLL